MLQGEREEVLAQGERQQKNKKEYNCVFIPMCVCKCTCTRCVKKQGDKEAAKDGNEKKRGCD